MYICFNYNNISLSLLNLGIECGRNTILQQNINEYKLMDVIKSLYKNFKPNFI